MNLVRLVRSWATICRPSHLSSQFRWTKDLNSHTSRSLNISWIAAARAKNCGLAMNRRRMESVLVLLFLSLPLLSSAYRPGDIVPMSKMGQYHSVCSPTPFYLFISLSLGFCVFNICLLTHAFEWFVLPTVVQSRTVWHDVVGKHCPIFAVNREVRFSWIC